MHLKVFVKLKKNLKTLSSGQKKTKKTQKNPKKPKKPQKNQKKPKNPLGWVFLKKPGFFPTLWQTRQIHSPRHWLGWGVTSGVRFGLAHLSNGL
jgi:hypothetical protein